MANDMIRMSGMNSGLDTEAIINALTANTKLKATKQERNVLKYEATQEAYRDIISKMQNIKNKYFDILNKDSYLSGSSMWNKYTSKIYNSDGSEMLRSGINVETTLNSQPGEYKVKVDKKATQTTLKGTSLTSVDKPNLKPSTETGGALVQGNTYGMTITVGGVEKNVEFIAGADEASTRNNLNQALEDAFGESNESVGSLGVKGMVYVNDDPSAGEVGQIMSRENKSISFSGIATMQTTNTLKLAEAKTGTNTVSFQVGDETVSATFQTIDKHYFDNILKSDGTVLNPYTVSDETASEYTDKSEVLNPEWENKIHDLAVEALGEGASEDEITAKGYEIEAEMKQARSIYLQVSDNYKESVDFDTFKDWVAANKDTEGWSDKLNTLYNTGVEQNRKSKVTDWLEDDSEVTAKYDEYKAAQQSSHAEIEDIYTWASSSGDSTVSTAFTKYKNKFDGLGNGDDIITYDDENYYNSGYSAYKDSYAKLALSSTNAYSDYTSSGSTDTFYDWVKSQPNESEYKTALEAAEASEDNKLDSFDTWKAGKIESDSWWPNKSSWQDVENNERTVFLAFRDTAFNNSTYDLSADNMIDFFNQTALKNSIGNLTTASGATFEVDYKANNNTASIIARDSNGEALNVSMSVVNGSANDASVLIGDGAQNASSTATQVSSTSKLSELGAEPDANGQYSFTINGVNFSFDGDTTIQEMTKKVNASSAGVKMTFSSLENGFTVTANKYGLDGKIDFGGTDDSPTSLLYKMGLQDDQAVRGNNLKVSIMVGDNGEWKEYETTGNSIEVDGTTFTFSGSVKENDPDDPEDYTSISVEKDTSAIKDLIKDFVKDYNQLIEDVYKYLDEKPEKDYYFLTDTDKEDLDLSEKQEEKWEEKSKKGLLYHDSLTTTVMTSLRTALMGSVEGLDGNMFSLTSMGLKTVTDYNKHGMFATVDEDALDSAITNHIDDIQKLFSDSENGIMKKFSAALDAGVGTTGENKGTLIRKAGLASGSTALNNEIYNAIKRTKTRITSLNTRYENEQNRLWKRYSNMESMLGTLNGQQASFSSYFMQ